MNSFSLIASGVITKVDVAENQRYALKMPVARGCWKPGHWGSSLRFRNSSAQRVRLPPGKYSFVRLYVGYGAMNSLLRNHDRFNNRFLFAVRAKFEL